MSPPSGAPERLDAVKLAVSSATTCTSTTVEEVRALFQIAKQERASSNKAVGRQQASKNVGKPRRKFLIDPGSRKANTTSNAAALQSQNDVLTEKQRFVLATEIINITLKVLTEAIKKPLAGSSTDCSDGPIQTERPISVQRTAKNEATSKPRPLQSRSHNRISGSSAQLLKSGRNEKCVSSTDSGLIAISECTRESFACLRAIEKDKSSDKEMPYLQLEKGASALIGKLIGLGFLEQATKEIWILRRRLITLVAKNKRDEDSSSPRSVVMSSLEGLTELLDFGTIEATEPLLDLITQTQIQVLKLITLKGKPICITALASRVNLTDPGSLIQLLLRPRSEATQANKIAQSLETVSQLLLRICSNIFDQESSGCSSAVEDNMEAAFRLYCLGLEVRTLWWRLANHTADAWKEILGPFSRIASKFASQAKFRHSQKLKLVEDHLDSLCRSQKVDFLDVNTQRDSSAQAIHIRIIKTLSDMAQNSELLETAIEWAILMLKLLRKDPDSVARLSACIVRIANLKIQSFDIDQSKSDIRASIQEALGCLCGDIKGDTTDLETLAVETYSLRKAALSFLSKEEYFEPIELNASSIRHQVNGCCRQVVLDTIGFFLKYLGPAPLDNEKTKDSIRHAQRKSLLIKWASQSVDGSFWLIKNLIDKAAIPWPSMDNAIQDSLGLIKGLGLDQEVNNTTSRPQVYFIKSSNLYWTYFQKSRLATGRVSNAHLLRCVCKSVEALESRSDSEKAAGLMVTKLEKLSNMFESSGKIREALGSSERAVLERVTPNVAKDMSKALKIAPLHLVWQLNDNMKSIERMLLTITKQAVGLTAETREYQSIFDRPTLDPEIQGGILEWILFQAIQYMVSHRQDFPTTFIVGLHKDLCNTYTPSQYPVRRLRVSLLFLWLQFAFPGVPHIPSVMDTTEDLTSAKLEIANSDQGLERFVPQLKTSISLFCQLTEDFPAPNSLQHKVKYLSDMMADSQSQSDKIDDVVVLLSLLRSLSDWAELHGQEKLQISVLDLIVKIDNLPLSNISADRLGSDLLILARQYLQQGYSAKAETTLNEVLVLLKDSRLSSTSTFTFHLARGEYYIAVGDWEQRSAANIIDPGRSTAYWL